MDTTLKALAYALQMEKEGENFYKQNADRIKSGKARQVFMQLAEMEKEHQAFIETQYKALTKGYDWVSVDALSEEDFSAFDKRQNMEHIPASEVESALGDIPILRMAYLLENDLAEYYAKMAEQTSDEKGKVVFKLLSAWEVKHRDMLMTEYKKLMESNWFDSGFAPF